MPYFDRFDIAEAYYVYMVLWHTSGLTERDHNHYVKFNERGFQRRFFGTISGILDKIKFKPRRSLEDEDDLSNNGREIYNNLIQKWEGEVDEAQSG